ncbi:hypothetical protein BDY19DRAFT_727768 [Irpex rosettiformis]|uniref:Uncharacterized protein n=1 Tax=Irpex rosettiformis TaxID=378272 RepID=A0ACB8U8V7_9APHY|nr:hypothetical protein BDY19DRAFT_727768 [Irpex rosettiformis]
MLNHLLQLQAQQTGPASFQWVFSLEVGPHNQPQWVACAYVRDKEYGRGRGRTKGDAKERAAAVAYQRIFAEMGNMMNAQTPTAHSQTMPYTVYNPRPAYYSGATPAYPSQSGQPE